MGVRIVLKRLIVDIIKSVIAAKNSCLELEALKAARSVSLLHHSPRMRPKQGLQALNGKYAGGVYAGGWYWLPLGN